MKYWNREKIAQTRVIRVAVKWLKRVSLPGFHGRSLYHVGHFFVRSLYDEDLMLRASSLAFSFFLALFPAIIFFFTLIAYIPIDNFQNYLLEQIMLIMPQNAYILLISTIEDIITKQNLSLLSFGFVLALIFSSNAFTSMMSAFNKYVPERKKRPWYSDRVRSIGLTFLVTLALISTIVIIAYVNITVGWVANKDVLNNRLIELSLVFAQYIFLFLLIYFIFSALYYFGSSKISEWHFFSAGSSLATFLSVTATVGFTFYVNNFNSYNKLYGSIGTILVLMMLIYFNCLVLLVGFELNSSIDRAEEFSIEPNSN
jgi:membrane protein